MKIKFKLRSTGESFTSRVFSLEKDLWDCYWRLRRTGKYYNFTFIGMPEIETADER